MASPDDKIDVNGASFYALHVALQTLKERCQNLQHRLTSVEDENEVLRKTARMDMPGEGSNEDYLRGMVGDLVRQKSQLTEHIAMVTKENRQLWSRLSKLTKENSSLGVSISKIRDAINNSPGSTSTPSSSSSARSNNLIRSKTFTRPNPKLRDRLQADAVLLDASSGSVGSEREEEEENMSLEEISLQIISKLVEGKENFEQKCGEILETTSSENLCFGFKGSAQAGVESGEVADTIDKCTTEATAMKDALLQQQSQLKQLIGSLNKNKKPICNDCITRQAENKTHRSAAVQVKSVDSQTKNDYMMTNGGGMGATDRDEETLGSSSNRAHSQMMTTTTPMDRTCPMCGKCYKKSEDFEIFQRHVEWHFIDDNELDLSIDKNYDMISHTAQNF